MPQKNSSSKSELLFGQIAVAKFLAKPEQIRECLAVQAVEASAGGVAPSLGELLVERDYITPVQVQVVLEEQRRQRGAKRFGPFELLSKLGEGGMGAVYKARRPSTGELLALKVVSKKYASNQKLLQRFSREAQVGLTLDHPNIIKTLDVGQVHGVPYFALQLVDGGSLQDQLNKTPILPERKALRVVEDVARALSYAKRKGLVHRDVKPDNIMFELDGTVKLSDFGLVKVSGPKDAHLTMSGITIGTPHYISPEQARSDTEVDIRSDIYSLGATLYRMVAGTTPFEGSSAMMVMTQHINDVPQSPDELNPKLSAGCVSLIARMMAKDPSDRPLTPEVLINEIRMVLDGKTLDTPESAASLSPTELSTVSGPQRGLPKRKRRRARGRRRVVRARPPARAKFRSQVVAPKGRRQVKRKSGRMAPPVIDPVEAFVVYEDPIEPHESLPVVDAFESDAELEDGFYYSEEEEAELPPAEPIDFRKYYSAIGAAFLLLMAIFAARSLTTESKPRNRKLPLPAARPIPPKTEDRFEKVNPQPKAVAQTVQARKYSLSEVQSLFKGRVTGFNNRTLKANIVYDFRHRDQLKDWVKGGKLLNLNGLVPFTEAERRRCVRGGWVYPFNNDPVSFLHAVNFIGNYEITYDMTIGDRGRTGGMKFLFSTGESRSQMTTYFSSIIYDEWKTKKFFLEGMLTQPMSKKSIALPLASKNTKKFKVRHKLMISGSSIDHWVNSNRVVAAWMPTFPNSKPRIPVDRLRQRLAICFLAHRESVSFGNVRISGHLEKAWLQKKLPPRAGNSATGNVIGKPKPVRSPRKPLSVMDFRRILKGQVNSYNPKNRLLSISYDFRKAQQAHDWEANFDYVARYKNKLASPGRRLEVTFDKLGLKNANPKRALVMNSKISFSGTLTFRYSSTRTLGYGGGAGLMIPQKEGNRTHWHQVMCGNPGAGKSSEATYFVSSQIQGAGGHGKKLVNKSSPGNYCGHYVSLNGNRLAFNVNGKMLLKKWNIISKNRAIDFEKWGPIYPFLVIGENERAHERWRITKVHITGQVSPEWLDAHFGKP